MSSMRVLLIALLAMLSFAPGAYAQDRFDLIVAGGRIVDGSGNPWYEADVGIVGDRIVSIGDLGAFTATRRIDATGLTVAPGFIDPHTHALPGVFEVPNVESSLLQGVTTLTAGNDGSSPFPIDEHYAAIAAHKISPNWAIFVGQGTIREAVIGKDDREATAEELSQMKQMVREAMEHGALGISTGLFYVPGSFTPTEEIIELSRIASEYDGIYISHMRDEAAQIIDSVKETIRIGIEADIPVQITHHKVIGAKNWGESKETLRLVDEARGAGVDLTIDHYPYTASQTYIDALIPQWAQEGGREQLLARINDPETQAVVKAAVVDKILFDRGGGHPKNIFISGCDWDRELEGKNLAEITSERGLEPTPENAADVVFDIIRGGGAIAVYHAIGPEDVDRIMQHPASAIGSDGPVGVFGEGAPHPRQYGSFARVLGLYVRERRVISLEEAIRKMSSASALRLGIRDRGFINKGYFADIAVFDADEIIDKATFENPHQYAVGMKYVLVNGEVVVENGGHTGRRPGRVLYGPGYVGQAN
ncbi:N-acyl-D-amino-acid deacylase family protein [Congregibacter sp.]|uniref:N-acyl-D-amino-acid deacylase family protein n=1 Tax=Congregibacter sp. TaxID=2744308 RepID=UPI003F6D29F2